MRRRDSKRRRAPGRAARMGSENMSVRPAGSLETFANPRPERDYAIDMTVPEFTCLCPMTGQPDFATLRIQYVPDQLCVELKSLKLYVLSYRDEGAFHEAVTNQVLSDLADALSPRYLRVTADFNVRGGIHTAVTVEHRQKGWRAPEPVNLPRLTSAVK